MSDVILPAIFLVIGVALLAYVVAIYNNLVEVRNNVGKAWRNIDVLLQQRHAELPKLVEAARGFVRHERDLLERITRLRAGYDEARSIPEKTRVENELNRDLARLRLAWEAYPDLTSSALFAQVMGRISALESAIADRRELFNDSVNIYNIRIERFPDLLVAALLRYGRHAFLDVPPERTADVGVSFT